MDFAIFDEYLYYESVIKLRAKSFKETKKLFKKLESLKHKYYFLGYVSYEFYKILENPSYESDENLAYFEGFAKKKRLKDLQSEARYYPKLSRLDFTQYEKAFKALKEAVAKGQSYQLNLTQELLLQTNLSGLELFKILAKEQNTRYKMYLKNEDLQILSFSPELFFKTKKRNITTKPMKGTISKGKNKKETRQNAKFLQNDVKNRSENVMIVDLLRNDLAHIAKDIKVKRLFEIESYKSLLQMTSTIKARLYKGVRLFEIFAALFPCGSVTGAPKKETMKLIKALEQRHRGIYCGALGLVHKDKSIFSVAIRTLFRKEGDENFRYGVGSGLVWDSKLEEEFRELELKSAFLKGDFLQKEFYLFETMYLKGGEILFFKEHLERLLASARHFNFKCDRIFKDFARVLEAKREYKKDFAKDLKELCEGLFSKKYGFFDELDCVVSKPRPCVSLTENESALTPPHSHTLSKSICLDSLDSAISLVGLDSINSKPENEAIAKLILKKDGSYFFEFSPLKKTQNTLLLLANSPVYKDDFSFHKSSCSFAKYHKLWQENKCFDIALFDEKKRLLEGSRSNLILQKDGLFYTPSLECGLLNGLLRQFLLRLGRVKEGVLYKKDLLKAQKIYAINSVRGLVELDLEQK